MKNKLWLFQIPIILLCTAAFWIDDMGAQGTLHSRFLRETIRTPLQRMSGIFHDFKFALRGIQTPKNRVVIVEIDSWAIDEIGRWPWHRDATSLLVEKAFEAGAKVVGLDIVFSESDRRVPEEAARILRQAGKASLVQGLETDPVLAATIQKYKDRLVLGYTFDSFCQPAYSGKADCPVEEPEVVELFPKGYSKFSIEGSRFPTGFDPQRTPLLSMLFPIANISMFSDPSRHAGYFNVFPDAADNVIRKAPLVILGNGRPYPSLALEMARVGMGEELRVEVGEDHTIRSIDFAKSGRSVPITPLGAMEINFRGPRWTFDYLAAIDVMQEGDILRDPVNKKFTGKSKREVLKDAYVLIGVSALGIYDWRAFPTDSNAPGVEGHANILDNLLSGDYLVPGSSGNGSQIVLALMTVGALIFGLLLQRMESVPALVLVIASMTGFGMADMALFRHFHNLNSFFLMIEFFLLFLATMSVRYIMEEKKRKFVKGAFAKYVSPVVVESIMKDPKKLALGGEKKDLTILFSDIRGFTTFSEAMDAKKLASFLHDYLGIMTDIVVENQGTLDKYIGDAIMAFWGAPLDQPDHAARACRAAQAMLKALAFNQERWKREYGIDVNVGVGVNSGVVSVGNMGSHTNFAYTVIGDHVNLASRLEGLTKYYGCGALTSGYTLEYIRQAGVVVPEHRLVDRVKVKGKAKAVELIQVLEKPLSEQALRAFAEARELYARSRFNEAIEKFHVANQLADGHDGVAKMYIERCSELIRSAPEADWDGSWKMDSK